MGFGVRLFEVREGSLRQLQQPGRYNICIRMRMGAQSIVIRLLGSIEARERLSVEVRSRDAVVEIRVWVTKRHTPRTPVAVAYLIDYLSELGGTDYC